MTSDERRIGVAISGGGHRATAFGLGALMALAEVGLNRQVTSISSVSGGSIANGVALLGADFQTVSGDAFSQHISPSLNAIAHRGVLLDGAPRTKWYLRGMIAIGAVGLVAFLVAIALAATQRWVAGLAVLAFSVGALAVAATQFRKRSRKTEAALDAEMFGGRKVTLAELQTRGSSVHHIICTTEIQTGVTFYFTNRAVYGYRYGGSTAPLDVPLAKAVQASACVPGAFAPRVLDPKALGLHPAAERIVLVDGGVYDNMADEWEYGFGTRTRNWPELVSVQDQPANFLVVVNGSGAWKDVQPVIGGGFALEKAGLLRAQGVQYNVSTAHRRRALFDRFKDDEGRDLDGAFIQITDSPYRFVNSYAAKSGFEPDDLSRRAEAAKTMLDNAGYTEQEWEEITHSNAHTATTLAKLGLDRTAQLLEHGYLLTRVNLYVQHGLGTLDDVRPDRFRALVGG
jgi:Patatin-like phospholipase